jgi:putative transposase
MDTATAEVLAFAAFPQAHWRKIWSTNPIEMASSQPIISSSRAA